MAPSDCSTIFSYFDLTILFVNKDVILYVFETDYFDLKNVRKVIYKIYICNYINASVKQKISMITNPE